MAHWWGAEAAAAAWGTHEALEARAPVCATNASPPQWYARGLKKETGLLLYVVMEIEWLFLTASFCLFI
jgi:hypothetical protein